MRIKIGRILPILVLDFMRKSIVTTFGSMVMKMTKKRRRRLKKNMVIMAQRKRSQKKLCLVMIQNIVVVSQIVASSISCSFLQLQVKNLKKQRITKLRP
jgi:hypothetical protein